MSDPDRSFLEGGIEEGSELYQKLLLESVKDPYDTQPDSKTVAPKPGFCLKSTDQNGKKMFVNICTSVGVIQPRDITEEELKEILATGDATKFRVPMAIGDKHIERDHSGIECATYDIVVHPAFYKKIEKNTFFLEFFTVLIYEGLESKHDVKLEQNYKILKNRKAMGTLQIQSVRTKSTPVIMEMDDQMYRMEKEHLASQKMNSSHIKELSTKISSDSSKKYKCPEYKIIREPPDGKAEFLIIEVKLPGLSTSKSLTLDVGEDCVILTSHSHGYELDVDLPELVNNEETGSQFNKKTKILTITMPCS